MARVGKGLFDIQGRLGDLIYYRYRGKTMVRTASSKKRNNFSQAQMAHQAKFAAVANFLKPLNNFLKITCKTYNRNKTGYQKAFSENYNNALTGTYPSCSIDYNKVWLGNGFLHNATDRAVKSTEPGRLIFSWSDNDGWNRALSSDQLYVAIYCEKLNQWIYRFDCAERCKHIYKLDVSFFSGSRVQIFMGFTSADKKQVSTPLYYGHLMVL